MLCLGTAWGPRHTAVQIQQRLERGKLLRLKRNDKHVALRHAELLALGTGFWHRSDILVTLAFVLGGTFMFLQVTNRVAGLGFGLLSLASRFRQLDSDAMCKAKTLHLELLELQLLHLQVPRGSNCRRSKDL